MASAREYRDRPAQQLNATVCNWAERIGTRDNETEWKTAWYGPSSTCLDAGGGCCRTLFGTKPVLTVLVRRRRLSEVERTSKPGEGEPAARRSALGCAAVVPAILSGPPRLAITKLRTSPGCGRCEWGVARNRMPIGKSDDGVKTNALYETLPYDYLVLVECSIFGLAVQHTGHNPAVLPTPSPKLSDHFLNISTRILSSMANLRWEEICVIVVDDNSFVRRLLASALHAFGVRNIVEEADGAGAIERLKLSRTDPIEAGIGEVDLILSDYMMPKVDGTLFLRWVRTGEGSPDRFVPFVIVSGMATKDVVQEARDAGVTGVLAKPFSVKSLADKVLSIVNANRQFILAPGYFGPDRRRTTYSAEEEQASKLHFEEERRRTRPEEIQTVKPDSNIRTLRENVRAIHFLPDNRVRIKLGPDALRGPIEFDPEIIRAAEERIQALVGDYSRWVEKYINSMAASLLALRPEEKARKSNRMQIAKINQIAHELHNQGGTFDYQLITELGASLIGATDDPEMKISGNTIKLIQAHIDGIRTVFKNRIQGTGGEVGEELLAEIKRAVVKYT